MSLKDNSAPTQLDRISQGNSSKILSESNIEMFLPIASKSEVLKVTLENADLTDSDRKEIADIFQSISKEAKFTKEIFEDIKNSKAAEEISKYFKIVYTNKNSVIVSPVL